MHAARGYARSTFASLSVPVFRWYIGAQIVSYAGSWVQRIAQDWLVLTISGSATDVGVTTALQFSPTVVVGLAAGLVADRYPKRTSLILTQIAMASGAAGLAALTLTGRVALWHVYLIAAWGGIAGAFDNPIRQAFVNELVPPDQRRNAIALNASVFQLGALAGPALAGALLASVGAGWAFAANACSYAAPVAVLLCLPAGSLSAAPAPRESLGRLRQGLRFVAARDDVRWPIVLVGAFGFFTVSMPVTLAALAKTTFRDGAEGYALLSLVLAAGSLVGTLASAYRLPQRWRGLATLGAALGGCELAASMAPTLHLLALILVPLGAIMLGFYTAATTIVQLAAGDAIRGRVMSIYLIVFIGCGAAGGPCIGAIDQHAGPRWGLAVAGVASLAALAGVARAA